MRSVLRTCYLLALMLLVSCVTEPEPGEQWELRLGDLTCCGLPIQASAEADGHTVTIRVTTWGNSCVRRGELRYNVMDRENRRLVLAPFDSANVTPGKTCLDFAQSFQHSGTIELEEEGTWTIVFVSRDRRLRETPVFHVERTLEIPGE